MRGIPRGPWSTLGLAIIGQFGVSMANQTLPALIPFIQADLALTKSQVGLFSSAGQLGNVASFYGGGWVADTFGVRRLILVSTIGIAIGLTVLAVSGNLLAALGALFLTGVGGGFGSPAISMMAIRAFDRRRRATAMGLKQTAVPAVGLIAALALPPAVLAVGWRPTGYVMAAVSIALGAWVFYRHREEERPVAPPKLPGAPGAFRTVVGSPSILAVSFFAMAAVAVQFCILSYYILYLTGVMHRDVVRAGQLLGLVQFGGMLGRIVWGLVSDRLLGGRRKPIFLLTGGLATILVVLLALLGPATPDAVLALLSLGIGTSALGWHGIHQTLVPELVEPRLAGQAIGTSMTISQFGPIFGPPIFGLIVDHLGIYQPAWLLFGGLAGLATVIVAIALREGVAIGQPTAVADVGLPGAAPR